MQQTETYHTTIIFEICCSLFICILIPLASLDTVSHICDLSSPGTIGNFLKLSHIDQWKFRLKCSRTSKGKSNKYSFLIASKRSQVFTTVAGCEDLFGLSGAESFLSSFGNSCAVVRHYGLNFFKLWAIVCCNILLVTGQE